MPERAAPGWVPDRVLTPELVRPVLAAQFPELAGLPVTAFDQGWDNAVMAVGERWLFRFVHRAVAVEGSVRERAVLAALGPRLPLAVPVPRFVGRPTAELPWPFWGAEKLPGVELARLEAAGSPAGRAAGDGPHRADGDVGLAAALGAFLAALHRPEHTALGVDLGLPVDPVGRGRPRRQADRARSRIAALRAAGLLGPDAAVDRLIAAAAGLEDPAGPPVLVHGDLHLRHVLVAEGEVGGVIDWGDTSLADPAVDLMLGFAAFEGTARAAFLTAYGPVPTARALHARVVALAVTAALAQASAATGQADVLGASLTAVARAAR